MIDFYVTVVFIFLFYFRLIVVINRPTIIETKKELIDCSTPVGVVEWMLLYLPAKTMDLAYLRVKV